MSNWWKFHPLVEAIESKVRMIVIFDNGAECFMIIQSFIFSESVGNYVSLVSFYNAIRRELKFKYPFAPDGIIIGR